MNNCDLVLELLPKMYKIMVMLKSPSYAKAIYIQLQIIHYHKMQGSFIWDMMQQNMCAFNEEGGEISFSVLSRLVLGDATKAQFDHISRAYSLLHLYREINQDLNDDIKAPLIKHTHLRIRQDCEEVEAVAAYFKEKIRELRSAWFLVYTGTKKSYARKNAEMVAVDRGDPVRELWIHDTTLVLDKMREDCTSKLMMFFLHEYLHIWPEGERSASPPRADDIEIFIDSDGEYMEEELVQAEEDDIDNHGSPDHNVQEDESPHEEQVLVREDDASLADDIEDHKSDHEGEISDPELEPDLDEDVYVDSPPRVSASLHDLFMRGVANSPSKRRRRHASEAYSYPYLP